MEKKIINVIKTDAGKCFITDCGVLNGYNYNYHRTIIDELLFDGEPAKSTYLKNWYQLDKYPELIQFKRDGAYINRRYELIDAEMASEKLPTTIPIEDESNYSESIIESLYKYTYDREPDYLELFECELVLLCDVKNFRDAPEFSYSALKEDGWDVKKYTVTNLNVQHSLFDSIILPSPLLADSPCKLSSKEMYNIVRQFIKDNINPACARITSDYDFCFEVKKIIPLLEPETVTYQNFFAKTKKERSKVRFVTHTEKEKSIFEMTHTQKNYSGYTPIRELTADNEWELKEKIDEFLKDLIAVINEPLCVCDKCKGSGYLNITI